MDTSTRYYQKNNLPAPLFEGLWLKTDTAIKGAEEKGTASTSCPPGSN
jgi:hypothetical protein